MKEGPIRIYWFSGTGNTLKICEAMAEVFRVSGREINLIPIAGADPVVFTADQVVGLAFPVACQGTYPFIWDFCRNLPLGEGSEVFMVDTLAKYSGGIVGPLGDLLREKGYRTIGAKEIQMPNNFLPRRESEQKLKKAVESGVKQAREFASELLKGTASWPAASCFSRLWGWMSRLKLTWRLMARLGKRMSVDQGRCVRCQKCVELCPVNNIKMEDFPVFGNKCVQCQRCVMLCPTGAILVKGKEPIRYRAVSVDDLLSR